MGQDTMIDDDLDDMYRMSFKRKSKLATRPAVVGKIHVKGVGRTKNDIIVKQMEDVFSASNIEQFDDRVYIAQNGAQCLIHIVEKTDEALGKLQTLNIFKGLDYYIDASKGSTRPNSFDVVVQVKEKSILSGGVYGGAENWRGVGELQINLNNMAGRAERAEAAHKLYSMGMNAAGQNMEFTQPLFLNPFVWFSTRAYQQSNDFPWSSYKETDRGLQAEVTFPSIFGAKSLLQWDCVWRELRSLNANTAFPIREQAGHSMKSSFKHIIQRDSLQNTQYPRHGSKLRFTQEIAGLGNAGDVKFIKHDLEMQLNKGFILDSIVQLNLAGGFLKPLDDTESKISDRFFIGGPLNLRGFNMKLAGPSSNGCMLGGNAYWLAGAHLFTPLPFKPGAGGFGDFFKLQFFVNSGNLINTQPNEEVKTHMNQLMSSIRLTYGAGLVFKLHKQFWLELNYCVPHKTQPGDGVKPGLQFGFVFQW